MEKDLFQIPALIKTIQTLSDRGLKLTVYTTRELSPDEELKVFQLKLSEGWMVFSPSDVQDSDIPDEPVAEFKGDKSPAQRYRGVLFKIWEQAGGERAKGPFQNYYVNHYERLIDAAKEKLV
jgi:hypothetical protein